MPTRKQWRARKGRSSNVIRKSLRFAIYARDNFDCVYCRSVFPTPFDGAGLTLDHVVPRSLGGSNAASNLVTACKKCNSSRQASSLAGVHNRKLRARIRRQTRRPLNRELGRWLVYFAAYLRAHRHRVA